MDASKKKSKNKKINPETKYSAILYLAIAIVVLSIAFIARFIDKPEQNFKDAEIAPEQISSDLADKLINQIKNNLNDMTNQEKTRQPAAAGSFYPKQQNDLDLEVGQYLQKAEAKQINSIKAIIAPHAGYIFSGQVAAYGYKQIEGKEYDKVIILGPSHFESLEAVGVSSYDYFKTPLGKIKLSKINNELAENDLFSINDESHEQEHSIEVQLPFLQKSIKNEFELIPLTVGEIDLEQTEQIAEILNKYIDEKTLIIASTDLSHYHPYLEAVEMDAKTIEHIINSDNDSLEKDELCGKYPVEVLIELAKINNWKTELLKYANSGDVTGDKEKDVVGYSSMVFYDEDEGKITQESEFSGEEKQFLLSSARNAIEHYLKTGDKVVLETENEKFKQKSGVFVTLKTHDGQLRGCIGYMEPVEELLSAVIDNAISAAVSDFRFKPLTLDELDDIKIEISVLTKTQKTELSNIRPDIDGVILQKGEKSATYLPQVWRDFENKDEFLQSLCQKAGLALNCYLDKDIEISTYQTLTFEEE